MCLNLHFNLANAFLNGLHASNAENIWANLLSALVASRSCAIFASAQSLRNSYIQSCQSGENAQAVQNNFYNGWRHNHYVNCLFLFFPDGRIQMCYFNCSGTVHDSTMAIWGTIYNSIDDVYRKFNAKIVVDSAFTKEKRPSLLRSQQK